MNTTLFKNNLFEIGQFILNPKNPEFNKNDTIEQPLIVFPNNSILIKHRGGEPFVADSSLINFYNHLQEYSRFAIDENGDNCIWIRLGENLLEQLSVKDKKSVFLTENQNCDLNIYKNFIKLMASVSQSNILDIEELTINIINQISKATKVTPQQTNINLIHKNLVKRIKITVHQHISKNQSLNEIASEVHSSPYHLSRIFKRVTGIGLNKYRNQIRLKKICHDVMRRKNDLETLALNYGYSSHSHLSYNFKKHFGFSPSSIY